MSKTLFLRDSKLMIRLTDGEFIVSNPEIAGTFEGEIFRHNIEVEKFNMQEVEWPG